MAARPNYLDLRSQSHGPPQNGAISRALPSPRLHLAGEIPPELSPLDAFAAQSRLLAKQLEKTIKDGNRVSRLPPLLIENSLNNAKPGYFRSVSADELVGSAPGPVSPLSPFSPNSGQLGELEVPGFRPQSMHPRLSGIQAFAPGSALSNLEGEEARRGRQQWTSGAAFSDRLEQSPTHITRERNRERSRHDASPSFSLSSGLVDARRDLSSHRTQDSYSKTGGGYDSRALAPPSSPLVRNESNTSSNNEDSEEELARSLTVDIPSITRKFSASSGLSSPPVSPYNFPQGRSPSISSEFSSTGTRLSRPAFNFSRPISRAGDLDPPSRQASSDTQHTQDSQPSFIFNDDTVHTPGSFHGEPFPDSSGASPAVPSYIYSKFSLPRGKMLQRNSKMFQDGLGTAEYHWEGYNNEGNLQNTQSMSPPSPPSRPSTSSLGQSSLRSETSQNPGGGFSLRDEMPSNSRPRPAPSMTSTSTITAASQHTITPSAEMTAEEHVAKGIACHENGSVKESTYHLRMAARQNHPTGMLLYALACRHGWGMRPNQKEGVQWLRKAADYAILEVTDDENLERSGKHVDFVEQKTRKAQFALSVYELGVSHMNGWGIEQDKALALRCFEIAGAWGDGDALAEAGFCYAQGNGCKKDLKKSAKLYRLAEAKGISMVGNSWIYKSKYKDDLAEASDLASPEKKKRDKSRTRTLFGRKKSNT